ncbi:hypothetical protein PoB_004630900 [Plakobranchus ocellatus]|uniref:Uncharacterized protein n=1 Tax=Plakobranchus ocellatus TaxID=259542 RepID=A0AAV4BI61_9GAST|nr:hypothetical protein PoB_004630900 [Plakobranchus ocellatus]
MCIFIDDDDDVKTTTMDGSESSNSGSPRLQLKNQRSWLVPRKIVMIILMVAVLLLFLGMVLLAIGGGIGSVGLKACGGVMFGFGIVGIIVCLLLCLYAYFYYGRKDAGVQTGDLWLEDNIDAPGYASIGRPSALKSNDSTLKRNGMAGQKKVTMAPGVGPYGESPPNGGLQGMQGAQEGSMTYGANNAVYQEAGAGGTSGSTKSSDPRGVGGRTLGGSEVGTGGIRITPVEGNAQPFPSPGGTTLVYPAAGGAGMGQSYSLSREGHVIYGSGGQGGQAVYSGGGSSANSSIIDAGPYAYPSHVVQGGIVSDGSSSQYSTLRSIPVTHIMSDSQRQQQQQQQLQRQQQETVQYARVNKSNKGGSLPAGSSLSSSSHTYVVQGQGQGQGHRFVAEEDFDYDNPVERTPMIPGSSSTGTIGRSRTASNNSNMSYHEQQMQFQRQKQRMQQQQQLQQLQQQQQQQLQQQQQQQQQQYAQQQFTTHHTQEQLNAPRQLGVHSLQRQYASNPYMTPQQQQQQQQYNYHTYTASSSSSSRKGQEIDDLPPEPQPLVYPSARRPMTFEQVSSSKMSVYDNMVAGMKDIDEE